MYRNRTDCTQRGRGIGTPVCVYMGAALRTLICADFGCEKREKSPEKVQKNTCIMKVHRIYLIGLLKAMMQEVAELSGNSCGELSLLDGGEGVRRF